jgi:hypothetical protein
MRGLRRTALLLCAAAAAHAAEEKSPFVDPQDGWFDLSNFLDQAYGAVPVVAPVTEPAVGYGAAGALIFIDRDPKAKAGTRPDLYAIGGMYTATDSWAAFGGYSGNWLQGDLRTLAAVGYVSLNLKHYGLGDDPALSQNPIEYNLRGAMASTSAAYRVSSTPLYAGVGVVFGRTRLLQTTLGEVSNTLLSLRPLLQFDTRDNLFTPTRGLFGEAGFSFIHQSEGSWFELLDLTAIGYTPLLIPELFLGIRAGAGLSFGDAPFYLRPFVNLRGAPKLRYQGEQAADLEVELRWQFWKRFSLVGFGGVGGAWNGLLGFERSEAVFTGGTGFRYELARKHGLHMGADFAFGQNGFAFYLQFGSAWMRL